MGDAAAARRPSADLPQGTVADGVHRDGKWVVSYGWNDVAVRFASFDAVEIEKWLVAVG